MTWGHFEQDNHQRKKKNPHKIKNHKKCEKLILKWPIKEIVAYREKIKEEGRTLP